MKTSVLLCLIFLIPSWLTGQIDTIEIRLNNKLVECHTADGKLHGKYKAFYDNDKQKVSGQFTYGQRTGIWNVWDKAGKLRAQRDYTNNLKFITMGDKNTEWTVDYRRNKQGVFPYALLSENDVMYYKRAVSVILPDDNPYLFNGEPFLRLMKSNREAQAFDIVNVYDRFHETSSDMAFENKKIIGFKIMQEFVYDSIRRIMEPRVVYIAPVLLDVITEKLHHNLWYDFQNIYPAMADVSVDVSGFTPEITNLADLFFWKAYTYRLVSIADHDKWSDLLSDIPDTAFAQKSTMDDMITNSLEKRVRLLETEHDLWISGQ